MFDWLRFKYELSSLHRQKRKERKGFAETRRTLEAQNAPQSELDNLGGEEYMTIDTIDDLIAKLQSTYTRNQADKYHLPIPEFDAGLNWETSRVTGHFRLTQKAVKDLRSAIRTEQKERSELARAWLSTIAPTLGGVTGIIGALIGLLTLIWRHQAGAP